MISGRKFAARAGVLALVAGGMTVIAVGPAQADTFTPGNTAPTVGTVDLAASITPTATGSAMQNVDVTVGDADSLLDLNTVRLCMYKTDLTDSACATPNAQNAMTLTWTRSTGLFVLAAGTTTTWTGDTSTVTGYTATGTSMTMHFNFKVGRAALQAGWTGKVTATDSVTSTSATDTTTVNYYSSITSRASQPFGTVTPDPTGATGTAVENVSDGEIVANGSSTLTMLQTAFTDTVTTAGIATGAAGTAVAVTKVALDCGNAATYAGSVAPIRLSTSPANLQTLALTGGTVELGTTALVNSCKLISGGQLPVGTYSATVTTGIGATS